ncbi:hypothetical protein [Neobacillus vireti]|uniref:hypothetical protein n=1 Tax=Neobacillus vireti TaxID=220686 RepID=UPI002FFE691E
MQLFLAYKFIKEIDEADLAVRRKRVEDYYYSPSDGLKGAGELERYESKLENIGLNFWQSSIEKYYFIPWQENEEFASCFTYAPNGWEQIVEPSSATTEIPLLFAREIKKNPGIIKKMTPPLIFSFLDKDKKEINIFNDSLGMAKLYELQTSEGVVYSNKLAALYLFMNKKAEMDIHAWNVFSSVGWFMGNTSPLKGSFRVKPGTMIKLRNDRNQPKSVSQLDGLPTWVSPRELNKDAFESEVQNIIESTRSYFKMFNFPVKSMLSGGRDSRVSSAILYKSGIDATFRTLGPITGEIETAKELIRLAGLWDKHEIDNPAEGASKREITVLLEERLKLLHFAYDGDFTPIKQKGMIHLVDFYKVKGVSCVGAGGEIATGNYYSNQRIYESILEKGEEGSEWRLKRYLASLGDTKEGISEAVDQEVSAILEEGRQFGLQGLSLMDYFYLKERLRRWAPIGGQFNSFTPFATPGFIRLSFDLTPEQRRNYELHKMLLKYLMPTWADVPFFKADIKKQQRDEVAQSQMRIWQTLDKEYVADVLENNSIWKMFYRPEETLELWSNAVTDGVVGRYEALFQRIVWIASFENHLNSINKVIAN